MSSANKKKLRREQKEAKLTEKQLAEKKENKKIKVYTIVTCAVLAAILVAFVAIIIVNSGALARSTTALEAGNHKVSAVELNYSYIDTINNFNNQYGTYANILGLDTTQPLDSQVYNEENGQSWADYFLEQAEQSVRTTYALYDAAKAEGYSLSEEDKKDVDDAIENLKATATAYGYSSTNACLKALYGPGANVSSYKSYLEKQLLTSNYYSDHQASLSYDDAARREMESDGYNVYSSFTYNTYYLNRSNFLEGGTKDENDKVTYSDEEYTAATEKAKAAADSLVGKDITSVEKFNEAIAALDINAEKEDVSSTAYEDTLYTSVNSVIREWVSDENRKAGDTTVIASTTTDADGNETVNGYYAVYYVSTNDNIFPLANVRHILVSFTGGTKDDNGNTTYSDEEKAATKASAEELLQQWKDGDATEESFAALATEKSTDTGSKDNGGLYENVYPGQMVQTFNDWCFEEGRKAGDTGIVESNYGYHVMYYVGDADITYRDYMIDSALTSRDMEEWYTALVDAMTINVKNVSKVNRNLILKSSSVS